MIAKLIAYGADRERGDRAAGRRARRVLYRRRVSTTSPFLAAVAGEAALSRRHAVDQFHRRGIPRRLHRRRPVSSSSRPGASARRRRWRSAASRERETRDRAASSPATARSCPRTASSARRPALSGRPCASRQTAPTGRVGGGEHASRDATGSPASRCSRAASSGTPRRCRSTAAGIGFRLTQRRRQPSRVKVLSPRAAELLALMPEKQPPDTLAPAAVADAGPARLARRRARARRSRPARRSPSSRR